MSFTTLDKSMPNIIENFSLASAIQGGYYNCFATDQCFCNGVSEMIS